MPAAEVSVSPDLVQRLLAAQQPDLAHLPIRVMAHGWDNLMYRLGDELAGRLPRRAAAAGLIGAAGLPWSRPAAAAGSGPGCRAGRAALGYPWPWSVECLPAGQLATREQQADPADTAVSLGGFLAALHAQAPPDAPAMPNRGIPLAERAAVVADNLSVLGGLVDRRAATRAWRAALAAPAWGGAPVWCSGDSPVHRQHPGAPWPHQRSDRFRRHHRG